MKDLLETVLRAGLVALFAVLAGCGPGSGGTGVGPIASYFSGTTGLSSTVGGVAAPSMSPVDLRLQETSVELTTECGRFVFTGEWAVNAGGTVVLPGRFERTGSSQVASLRMQFSEGGLDSRQVTVTVLDAAGGVVLGPVTLDRASTLPARPATGCS